MKRLHHRLLSPLASVVVASLLVALATRATRAADGDRLVRVTFVDKLDQPITVEGKIVVEAADGGILLLGRDGRLWTVSPKNQKSREATSHPFSRLSPAELAGALQEELGPGFEIVQTRHYVIATSTGAAYAQWCGELFERLLTAFLAHWKSRGLDLTEPSWPLAAIIFADEGTFKAHAAADAGEFGESSKGYYSIRTNRIILYDLTAGRGKKRATTPAEIKRRTAAAGFNVATIVHEATHQIAFNSGMHTRYADNPLWLTEGMAMSFETPDLDGGRDWKTIGQINRMRYDRFLEFARRRRKRDSLTTLISQPKRFTDSRLATDAYAEAWALTYFLNEKHPEDYARYLKLLSKKPPLIADDPTTRLDEFKSAFGPDLAALDREFQRSMKGQSRKVQ